MLRAENITKSYGALHVLRGCSLSITPGDCLIVRGRSGAGKSTLLRMLALMEQPSSGTIHHDGKPYRFGPGLRPPHGILPSASPYPLLTVVFQQLYLWPNLTIAENISLVTQRNRYAPLTEIELAMLDRLNISEIAAKHPHHCSLGQRQRATVARALLTQARFLLMDEPTSALDRHNRTVMAAALSEARATGRGFLIISHDERDFESVATSTFELDGGVLRPL